MSDASRRESAGRPWVPIPVRDVELTQPTTGLGDLEGAPRLRVIARVRGVPVADLTLSREDGSWRDERWLRVCVRDAARGHVERELKRASLSAGAMLEAELLAAVERDCTTEAAPSVTVAVCTRNRAAYVRTLLAALERQRLRCQLLVIDNAPADGSTADLARARPDVRYVVEQRPGLDHARNRALAETKTELVCFIDDDAEPDAEWVHRIVCVFARCPELDGVTGLVLPRALETEAQAAFESWGGFGRTLRRRWFVVHAAAGERVMDVATNPSAIGVGVNMAFRADALRRIGGFDPVMDVGAPGRAGGDLDAFFRLLKSGGAILYDPAVIVRHDHRRSMRDVRAQVEAWSFGYMACLLRAGAAFPDERGAIARLVALGLVPWNVRRLLTGSGREWFPRSLAVAEARGLLHAAARVALWSTVPAASAASPSPRFHDGSPMRRAVNLDEPLQPLPDAAESRRLILDVRRGSRHITQVVLRTGGRPFSADRLCDELVDRLPATAYSLPLAELADHVIMRGL